MAYINGREIIDFVRFGVDAYPLGGTWCFKVKLTPPPVQLIEQPLNFYYTEADGDIECTKITVTHTGSVSYLMPSGNNYAVYDNYGWGFDAWRTVTINETQEVSKDFYYWFTANAEQITEA